MTVFLPYVQVVSTLIAFIALFFVGLQLRNQTKQIRNQTIQRDFEALTRLHQELLATPMQHALRFIHNSKPEDLAQPRSPEVLDKIELVLNTFDLIGFRVSSGLLPKLATLETEWTTILPLWAKIEPFVKDQRARRKNSRYKWFLEQLVRDAARFKDERKYEIDLEGFQWQFEKGDQA